MNPKDSLTENISPVPGFRTYDPKDGHPVLRYRAVWVSDIHLGSRGCQAEKFLDFIRHIQCDYLYLVGDIVDFWQLRKRWYWPQEHNDVVQKILRCARKGTSVFYIPGNHDEAVRSYCGLTFGGVLLTNEAIHTTLKGQRLLIVHGDQFDAFIRCAKWLAKLGDSAYTLLLQINAAFNFVRRKLGFSYWSLSAYVKHKVKNAMEHISAFETVVAEAARRHGVDGVVCGHIHQTDMRMIGKVLYCNDGDWVESCTAMVEDLQGRLHIIDWPCQRADLLGETPKAEEKPLAFGLKS